MRPFWLDSLTLNRPGAEIAVNGMGLCNARCGIQRIIPAPNTEHAFVSFIFNHDSVPIYIDGRKETLPENTLCAWSPDKHLVNYGGYEKTWRISWFQVFGSGVERELKELDFPLDRSFNFPDARLVSELYVGFINELCLYKSPDPRILLSLFRTVLLEALRTLSGPSANERRRSVPQKLQEAKSVIEEHYSDGLDLKSLAKLACMSPEHFCRRFKQEFGVSPIDHMMELRISEVARSLVDKELPIREIAAKAGFLNMSNFSKTFKRRFGTSPLEYRRSLLRNATGGLQ